MANELVSNKTSVKRIQSIYIVKEADSSDLYDDIIAGDVELAPLSFVQLVATDGSTLTKLTGEGGGTWGDAQDITSGTSSSIQIEAYTAGGVAAGSLQETIEALADRIVALEQA